MGALHGALVGGILGTTFSSSQGLMLMIPDMYVDAESASHLLGTRSLESCCRASSTWPAVRSPSRQVAFTVITVMFSPRVVWVVAESASRRRLASRTFPHTPSRKLTISP